MDVGNIPALQRDQANDLRRSHSPRRQGRHRRSGVLPLQRARVCGGACASGHNPRGAGQPCRHPLDPDPTYMGHSIGHWEGSTLVVDTVGLVESTPIDWLGTPHSADLHLLERYRRLPA